MTTAELLEPTYALDPADVEAFRRDGFVILRGALAPDALRAYEEEITRKVIELNTMHLPMEERSTYDRAFLQVMNLWRESELTRELVFSSALAGLARDLLGTAGVRLYHDQALYKEPSGGITPWHADQYYWPLSTDRTCTAWIPLQDTPDAMGPLSFAAGSHRYGALRDIEIGDDSERLIAEAMERERFPYAQEPFALGDVSFHTGWTLHRAPANTSEHPRRVMTVIYMDRDIRVTEPENDYQRNDHAKWLSSAPVGEVPDGPLNPVLA